ncbi:monocarboxylate transporter 13-like [Amphiura filiformis]|uniref:monocarboxylate transporter 13-like n=1 Tax=Amphiura filiformis TaxID=82378 RepID=UPI003B21C502
MEAKTKEPKKSKKSDETPSKVSDHRPCRPRKSCHQLGGASILDKDSNAVLRRIRESIQIRKKWANAINRDDGSFSLSHVYDPLLKQTLIPRSESASKHRGKCSGSKNPLEKSCFINIDHRILHIMCLAHHWRWVIPFAAMFTGIFTWGIMLTYGLVFNSIQNEFNGTSASTGWVGSLALASACLGSPITSALLIYLPYRILVLGGSLLCTASLVCSSFVPSVHYLFLTYGLAYGFGVSLNNQATIVLILRIFSGSHDSRALSIAVSGANIGKSYSSACMLDIIQGIVDHGKKGYRSHVGTLWNTSRESNPFRKGILTLGPLIAHLVHLTDWRVSFRILSAILFVATIPAGLLISPQAPCGNNQHGSKFQLQRDSPPELGDEMESFTSEERQLKTYTKVVPNETENISDKKTIKKLIFSVDNWMLFTGIAISALASTFFIINLVPFILSNGCSPQEGTQIVIMLAISQALGKILLSAYGDHLPFAKIYLLSFANCCASVLSALLLLTDSFKGISAVIVGVGVTAALYDILPFPAGLEVLGPNTESETSALVYLGVGTGYVIGAAAPSGLFDLTGSYSVSLILVAGLYALSAVVLFVVSVRWRWKNLQSTNAQSAET